MTVTLTDLFCGAGGSSTGALDTPGVTVRLAANHWDLAIETHNTNHPTIDHLHADISQTDPRYIPATDLLWASPECFAAGTLVLTERGLVPIEDVVVSDLVLTHAGRYRPVTHVMSRRADTVRLIGQGLTRGLEVTTEHPILTTTGAGVTDWTKVADIDLDGRTRWATPTEHPAASIPAIGGSRPVHVEDPRFAWLVGRWLGDGSLRVRAGKSSEAFITCGKHEADDLERYLTWVHHDCGVCAPELTWARRELRTAYIYASSHSEFARWLLEHFGRHSHGKTMPAWALGAPIEWRLALLDGYLSADGHDNGRGWQAASVSKHLALGIRLLAESLGHRVGLTYSHRDTWRIEGRTGRARPQWSVQWLHHIHRETRRTATEFGGHSWGTVNAVEPASTDVPVYDLTVDEDHSYVADGIVVHNCTNHSRAKGRRQHTQPDLFGDVLPDEAAERSRATMWDVVRFTEVHGYRAVLVENVVEVVDWSSEWGVRGGLFQAWLSAMHSMGYRHRIISLNSMHAQAYGLPAPQSRDRVYIAFWRESERAPDFERMQRPKAWCPGCGTVVDAMQAWKKPGARPAGRYRQQYLYRCPHVTCRNQPVEPAWLPASTVIDWSNPGRRIGDRDRPLAEKTMRRIQLGIERYWAPIHLEAAGNTYDATSRGGTYLRAWPDTDPFRTMHGTASKALAWDPLVAELRGGGSTARPASDPLSTVTASGNHHGLVMAHYGNGHAAPTGRALSTVTTVERHALIHRHNEGGAEMTTPAGEPVRTITTKGHQSLLQADRPTVDLDDVRFRMLEPGEIKQAMAFPPGYVMRGNRREQVKLSGNAVTPPAARDLIATVVEAITGEDAANA